MIRNTLSEFREFILKGNAFDLAVGVIIGAAFSGIVTSLVNDILMPPIGAILGGVNFADYFLDLTALIKGIDKPGSVDAAQKAGHAVIAYGKFINALINLIIIGAVIFTLVKQITRFRRTEEAKPVAAAEIPDDVKLLSEIRDLLARGSYTAPKI
jgi:large conductance mechanosensitive channel